MGHSGLVSRGTLDMDLELGTLRSARTPSSLGTLRPLDEHLEHGGHVKHKGPELSQSVQQAPKAYIRLAWRLGARC